MLVFVHATNDIAAFLTSRRARVPPERSGCRHGVRAASRGQRREEVASLAGVSLEYLKRPERGIASGVSDSVLEAFARALQLDDAERAHLVRARREPRRPETPTRRPGSPSWMAPRKSSTSTGAPSR
jgi:hypothetical protein